MKKYYILTLFLSCFFCVNLNAIPVTFRVDMSDETVSANGVHVAGSFQGWDPAGTLMSDDDEDGIYEVTVDIFPGPYMYKYVNGNAWQSDGGLNEGFGDQSGLADCGVDDGFGGHNREVTIPDAPNFKVDAFKYNTCEISAIATATSEPISTISRIVVSPNPFSSQTSMVIENPTQASHDLMLTDVAGKVVRMIRGVKNEVEIKRNDLNAGVYYAIFRNEKGETITQKLIIQ